VFIKAYYLGIPHACEAKRRKCWYNFIGSVCFRLVRPRDQGVRTTLMPLHASCWGGQVTEVLVQTHCFSVLHTGESNWSYFKQACFLSLRLEAEGQSIDLLIVNLVHPYTSHCWRQCIKSVDAGLLAFLWFTLLMPMDQGADRGLLTHSWGAIISANSRLAAVRLHTGEADRIDVLMQCSFKFPCA
jgi:hypothetical protein